jgi:STAS-like domain of unknown function (DUF4325)
MKNLNLSIAKDYSPFPAGRYINDGPFSAEKFRDSILIPRLKEAVSQHLVLVVHMDGLLGISSSFLEEVFGGLVRTKLLSSDQITSHLKIDSGNRAYEWAKIDAEKYLSEAVSKH